MNHPELGSNAIPVQTRIPMPRGLTFPSLLYTIGDTPLVGLQRTIPAGHARVLVKCEFLNPMHSVKDRVVLALVESAERDGSLVPDGHIVEPTSGNTGIALAFVAASKGYRLTIFMPETMSRQRRMLIESLGAQVVLTPGRPGDMRRAIEAAQAFALRTKDTWMPRQFENPANPRMHEFSTGPEIWADTSGQVDIFVAGVGTGGTITGVTRYLRTKNPALLSVAVEPAESAVLSGGRPGPHQIQGLGAGFLPAILDTSLLSSIETVTTEEAVSWARRLARQEGIFGGISTGANVAVAARLAARPEHRDKTIVTVASSAHYLSTELYGAAA
jgi:cysteine synthase